MMDREYKKMPIRAFPPPPLFEEGKQAFEEIRRNCGCLRTSDKLKRVLQSFPPPPPPTPIAASNFTTSISAFCAQAPTKISDHTSNITWDAKAMSQTVPTGKSVTSSGRSSSWRVAHEMAQLLQLSVMATALVVYYLIYCYMQLIYYTLRSALYFHNADGPMKITIGVVTFTSLVVAFNLILRFKCVVGM